MFDINGDFGVFAG